MNARWGHGRASRRRRQRRTTRSFDFCYVNDRPDLTPQNFRVQRFSANRYARNDEFCRVVPSWWDGIGSQMKLQAVYPLPYDIVVSGVYKHLPGIPVVLLSVGR